MRSLICPTSSLRISGTVVRITGFMMASMIAVYALTGMIWPIALIALDYSIRAFTTLPYSPFSWLASRLARALGLSSHTIDKAPKIFAARVGFLFAASTLLLHLLGSPVALVVALVLMGFALLEALVDFCMGCFVYTHVVLPAFGER